MKYTWESSQDCEYWTKDEFDTVEECVKDAIENYKYSKGEEIVVGEVVPVTLDDIDFSLDRILENIGDNLYDECGEVVEGYWDELNMLYINNREVYELIYFSLKNTLKEQLKKYNLVPSFCKVDNIRTVKL